MTLDDQLNSTLQLTFLILAFIDLTRDLFHIVMELMCELIEFLCPGSNDWGHIVCPVCLSVFMSVCCQL